MSIQPPKSFWQRLRAWRPGRTPRFDIHVHLAVDPDKLRRRWESLTPRQKQIAILICQGHTNPQIAEQLHISTETVKTHIRRILYKFNLRSKAELRLLISIEQEKETW